MSVEAVCPIGVVDEGGWRCEKKLVDEMYYAYATYSMVLSAIKSISVLP